MLYSYVLIPLNQGLFLNKNNFQQRKRRICLNPFESGAVFKCGVLDFLFLSILCKAAFQFFSCCQSCLIFSPLPYFLSSAVAPMLRLLSAASMRYVPPDGLLVVVAAGFTGWCAGMTGSDCPCARPNDFEFESHRMRTCRRRRWWRQWLKYGCVFHS